MDYFHKYNKYKIKYLNLKNKIGGAALASTDREINELNTPFKWEDNHRSIFLNILLICAGLRKCYFYPSNLSMYYHEKYYKEVFSLIEEKLNYLLEYIDYPLEKNISLYNNRTENYVKRDGVLLKKKDIDLDYKQMGLENDDSELNEEYIGKMLGFGDCSGKENMMNGKYSHQLKYFGYGKEIDFMNFICDNSNEIIDVKKFLQFIKSNQNLTNIINENFLAVGEIHYIIKNIEPDKQFKFTLNKKSQYLGRNKETWEEEWEDEDL